MEIGIVGKNENLLDEIPRCCWLSVIDIVPTDMDHLTDLGTHDEKCTTIHTRNRIINNDNFFSSIVVSIGASEYSLLEIQESNEILFSFTKVVGNFIFSRCIIGTYYRVVSDR